MAAFSAARHWPAASVDISVEFDADIAYTDAYFTAWHRPKGEVPDNPVLAAHTGTYDEDALLGGRHFNWFERRAGVWKICRHNALVEWERWGSTDERSPLAALGQALARRDRTDPVYEHRQGGSREVSDGASA